LLPDQGEHVGPSIDEEFVNLLPRISICRIHEILTQVIPYLDPDRICIDIYKELTTHHSVCQLFFVMAWMIAKTLSLAFDRGRARVNA
jgi:hypothetical protein